MTATEFIQKAIEGGWKTSGIILQYQNMLQRRNLEDVIDCAGVIQSVCLDPKAWQAVGKIEGWIREDGTDVGAYIMNDPKRTQYPIWKWNMHRMVDALCEGKTIEEYLQTL